MSRVIAVGDIYKGVLGDRVNYFVLEEPFKYGAPPDETGIIVRCLTDTNYALKSKPQGGAEFNYFEVPFGSEESDLLTVIRHYGSKESFAKTNFTYEPNKHESDFGV